MGGLPAAVHLLSCATKCGRCELPKQGRKARQCVVCTMRSGRDRTLRSSLTAPALAKVDLESPLSDVGKGAY